MSNSKTPEDLAREFSKFDAATDTGSDLGSYRQGLFEGYLAGYKAGFESARQQFVNAAKEFVYAARAIKTPLELSHEEIRKFYVDNFGTEIPVEDEEAIFWAWTKSNHMQVISWLAHGFKTGREMSHKEMFDYYMELRKARWISVAEKLPEDRDIVAVWTNSGDIHAAWREDGCWLMFNPCCTYESELKGVSHWHEIEDVPEEKEI